MNLAFTNGNKALLIRRFLAIGLVVLSTICLFWPSMFALHPEYREALLEDALPSRRAWKEEISEEIDSLFEDYEDVQERFWSYSGKKLPNIPLSKSEICSDAATLYDAIKDGRASVAETRTVVTLAASYASALSDYLNDLCARIDKQLAYSSGSFRRNMENVRSEAKEILDPIEEYALYVRIASIALNILFFGILAATMFVIVMMVLNRMNFNWVHTILAFLCTGAFLAAILVTNSKLPEIEESAPENLLVPGVGLFLMPLLSLAACILYRRDKSAKAPDAPKAQPAQQQPWEAPRNMYAQPPMQQPWEATRNTYAQPPMQQPAAQSGWTCRNCGTINSPQARFCGCCGSPKPEPQPQERPSFCNTCGNKINPNMPFCPYCGAKQG